MAGEWYNVGDNTDLELVYDLNYAASYTAVSGDVTLLHNIGSAASIEDLAPTTGDAALSSVEGVTGMVFDGGAAVERYRGGESYAAGFMSTEREVFAVSIYAPGDLTTAFQATFGIGVNNDDDALHMMNGSTTADRYWRYDPSGGARIDMVTTALPDVENEVSVAGLYHNGVDEVTCWHNGFMLEYKNAETGMPGSIALGSTSVAVGDLPQINFPMNGLMIGLGVNNSGGLTWADAHTKYAAAFNTYAASRKRDYLVLVTLGQSNGEGDYTGGSETFTADGFDFVQSQTVTGGVGLDNRSSWGHGTNGIGASSPGVWFLKEWQELTGENVCFQQQAEGNVPVIPGLTGSTAYWAPEHIDGVGQDARMTTLAPNLQNFTDLQTFSPGMNATKVGLLVCGETEALQFNSSDALATQGNFEFHLNRWLDELVSSYGFDYFAIVLTGRRGTNQTAVDNNTPGVTMARDALTSVINSRSDCFSVYPHLNNTTFVLDDLVVDADGYWVSGQANNADGIHYTSAQYEAMGRTAAKNLYDAINSATAPAYMEITHRNFGKDNRNRGGLR